MYIITSDSYHLDIEEPTDATQHIVGHAADSARYFTHTVNEVIRHCFHKVTDASQRINIGGGVTLLVGGADDISHKRGRGGREKRKRVWLYW